MILQPDFEHEPPDRAAGQSEQGKRSAPKGDGERLDTPSEDPGAHAHVNPPLQARSRRTLERIVRAALSILEEEGPDALTVQGVVARAGSSVGSFYARFGGKEDLLDYLGARVWDDARERWDSALADGTWEGLGLGALSERAVRLLVEARGRHVEHLRALDRLGAGHRDGFARFQNHVLDGLAQLFLAHEGEIRHADPALAIRLGLAAVRGMTETADPVSGERYPPEVLQREGRALLATYLGAAPPGGASAEGPPEDGEDEDVDFFDVWG